MAGGAKRFGASTTAAWLSLLGGFLGALILGPFLAVPLNVVGPVAGAFLGAFISVVLYERRQKQNWREALRAGWGTLLGRVAGIALKMVVGVGMVAAVAWSVLTAMMTMVVLRVQPLGCPRQASLKLELRTI